MKRLLLIILCVLSMGFIFYNSSNSGIVSNEKSYSILNNLKNEYHTVKQEEKLNFIVRKNAHAFEYFILAISTSYVLFSFNFKGRKAIVYIMFICLLYAVTDEFHQMFVPGRTSLVSDVLIDFSGSLIGTFIFYIIYYKIIHKAIRD